MTKALSYITAAQFWNIPCLKNVLGYELMDSHPVHFVVFNKDARFREKNTIVHLCTLPLPRGAVAKKKGVKVVSPEFLFLQFANTLDIHRLILLGLQLCSYPPGNPKAAITSRRKLTTFLNNAIGHSGQKKALKALDYIADGSASIMESLTYLILTLPHFLGGYNLSGAHLNYEITLTNENSLHLGQNKCFADLYYTSIRLAIEYESFTYHNSPAKQGKSFMRASTLTRQGIEVILFSTIQLYNEKACRDFAFNLAALLGKRIQIRCKNFEVMHARLRELLPVKTTLHY